MSWKWNIPLSCVITGQSKFIHSWYMRSVLCSEKWVFYTGWLRSPFWKLSHLNTKISQLRYFRHLVGMVSGGSSIGDVKISGMTCGCLCFLPEEVGERKRSTYLSSDYTWVLITCHSLLLKFYSEESSSYSSHRVSAFEVSEMNNPFYKHQ